MYKIQLAPLAKDDLLNIDEYLNIEFDEFIAKETMDKLIGKIRNIKDYPLLGRPLTNLIDIPT